MDRPVHAFVLPPGPRLHRALRDALADSGPAVCPLPTGLPEPALAALLAALRPAKVITADGERPGDRPLPTRSGTAVLIATSGSTGNPKIVELSAGALRHSAAASLRRLGAGPGGRWLCCLPTSHVAGVQVLVRSLVAGTEPVIHERFDPAAVAGCAGCHIAVVPTQLRRLIDAGADLSRFPAILLGGAAAPAGLLMAARARGGRVVTTYGMSETCGGCVYDGVPLDGVSADVGGDGRIMIAGPVLFDGYRLRPGLTASARRGRWFVTEDLGTVDDGVLRVLGRADDVINTGGEKVVAGEVERVLAGHPAVRDVVVVGRPDPEWGARVTAVVVPAGTPPALAELRAWVREVLPACAAPRELRLVEAIPLLPSGKPDRAAAAAAAAP
jgi:O-succinylbenzoic acid--CoA ligase